MLRLGSQGVEVVAWQAFLQAQGMLPGAIDGVYGPRTEDATLRFQERYHLDADGVVGHDTYTQAVVLGFQLEGDVPGVRLVPARWFAPADHREWWWIVVHATDGPETPRRSELTAQMFARERRASAHYIVDPAQVIQCVRERDEAWHVGGQANKHGLGIEHCGRADQTAEQWRDELSTAELQRSARLCAWLAHKYAIPIQWVSANGLKSGVRGFTGHADCVEAGFGGSHTDPGTHFPWAAYLEMVLEAQADMRADWS